MNDCYEMEQGLKELSAQKAAARAARDRRACELHQEGLPLTVIGRRLGCSPRTVAHAVQAAGLSRGRGTLCYEDPV